MKLAVSSDTQLEELYIRSGIEQPKSMTVVYYLIYVKSQE